MTYIWKVMVAGWTLVTFHHPRASEFLASRIYGREKTINKLPRDKKAHEFDLSFLEEEFTRHWLIVRWKYPKRKMMITTIGRFKIFNKISKCPKNLFCELLISDISNNNLFSVKRKCLCWLVLVAADYGQPFCKLCNKFWNE